MSESFLYLTTTGRKSGLPRRIEIWYVCHNGGYYLVSERRERSHWVQNLQRDSSVQFSVGPRARKDAVVPTTQATARTVEAADEPQLAATITSLMDEKYRWSDGLIVELMPIAKA